MEKVQRILRKDLVVIRPYLPVDRPAMYEAYLGGSFPKAERGMSYAEFTAATTDEMYKYASTWTVLYRGQMIGVVLMNARDGYAIEPHVDFFHTATKSAILKSTATFFLMLMSNESVGACVVRCLAKSKGLFNRMVNYGMLLYVGKIPNGNIDGDEYLYCLDRRET